MANYDGSVDRIAHRQRMYRRNERERRLYDGFKPRKWVRWQTTWKNCASTGNVWKARS